VLRLWHYWSQLAAIDCDLRMTNDKLLQVAMAMGHFSLSASHLVAKEQPEVLYGLVNSCINTRAQGFEQVILNQHLCQVHSFSVVVHHVVLEDDVSRELLRANASSNGKVIFSQFNILVGLHEIHYGLSDALKYILAFVLSIYIETIIELLRCINVKLELLRAFTKDNLMHHLVIQVIIPILKVVISVEQVITPSRLIVNNKNALVKYTIFLQHVFRIATLPRDKVFEVPVCYWWGNNFGNVISSLLIHDVIANKEMWLGQWVVNDISQPSL